MTITTYDTLSTAVQNNMLGRTELATAMPDLVMTAEHMIFHGVDAMKPLRCRKMEEVATLVPASGICPLPANYLQWKQATELSSPRRILDNVPKDYADQQYPSRVAGPSDVFWIVGESLYTAPLVQNNVELTHYALPTALDSTSGATVNTFLSAYPLIYLRATVAAACEYLKDWEELQTQMRLLNGLIMRLNGEDQLDSMAKSGLTFRKQVR